MSDEKKDAVATQQPAGAMTVPAGMEGMITTARPEGQDTGALGNEGLTRDEVLMPRLDIAQKTSKTMDPTQPNFIKGLEFTDLYHSLTGKIYGKGPLYFVILKRDDPRWMELIPIAEGGGVKDRDVKREDPRTKFVGNQKPIATKFMDYVILLLNDLDMSDPLKNVIVLSLKSSGLKAAMYLNFLTNLRGPKKIWKGVYLLTSGHATDKKTNSTYAIYKIDNAGWVAPDSPVEKMVAELAKSWEGKEIKVDREPGDEPFEPEPEAGAAGAAADTTEM